MSSSHFNQQTALFLKFNAALVSQLRTGIDSPFHIVDALRSVYTLCKRDSIAPMDYVADFALMLKAAFPRLTSDQLHHFLVAEKIQLKDSEPIKKFVVHILQALEKI